MVSLKTSFFISVWILNFDKITKVAKYFVVNNSKTHDFNTQDLKGLYKFPSNQLFILELEKNT